jgi:putative endonuclease
VGNHGDKVKRKDIFYVYIVRCADGTYYTGYTNNLEKRIKLHNNRNGARYLKSKLPVRLVYAKEYRYYKNVLHAERNLKKRTRKEKEEIIKNYKADPHRFVPNLNMGINREESL